ncbi:MAG: hypothetical protein KKD35_06095, partial [Elusimicrobia bacterium]|nr:hypothetical protein [Elusimicrobiota bacterium]
MDDSTINSNIFSEKFSSFARALKQFKSLEKLTAPVQEHTCLGKQIYTIPPHTINSEEIFPIFTDINAIEPPLLQKAPLDFLKIIFCNPAIQTILINPPLEKTNAKIIAGKTLKLNRNQLSAMIGSFQVDVTKENADDFTKNIMIEMNNGNLHNANYISNLALAKGKAQQIAAIYPQILINLRLYQDAYDFIKIFPQNPLMLYYSAIIFRVTGNFKKTSEILHSIAENAGMENKKTLQKAWIDMSLGNLKDAEIKFKKLLNSPLEKNEASIGLGMTLSKKGFLEKDFQALNESLDVLKKSLGLNGGLNAQAHFYIGNIYFKTAKHTESVEHYEESFKLTPSLPTMINMTNVYLNLAKYEEAIKMVLSIALVDLNAAESILSEFPTGAIKDIPTIHPDISTTQGMSQYANIFNITKPQEKKKPLKNDSKSSQQIPSEGFIHEIADSASTEIEKFAMPFKKAEAKPDQPAISDKKTPSISSEPKEEPKKELPPEKEEPISIASLERNEPVAQSDRITPPEESDSTRMASLERNEPVAQSNRIMPLEESSTQETEYILKMESSSRIFSSNIQNTH